MIASYFYRHNRDVRIFMMMDEWPARNLKAKGVIGAVHFLTRSMTDKEIEDYADAKRAPFEQYTDWEQLIQDDIYCDVPVKQLDRIRKFSENHNLPGASLKLLEPTP